MSNIEIKITANTTELVTQMTIAKAQLASAQKALNDLGKEAAKSGGELSSETKAAMNAAAESVLTFKNQVGALNRQINDLKPPPSSFHDRLKQVLDVGLFLELQQVASQALHVVDQAFEQTITKAEEFSLSTAKFAALLGIDGQAAAALAADLRGVGSSSDEYASMALKLERQLKTNESGLHGLGMATRDQNGNLLDGKALMESAIATMGKYKAGTDQNEFALLAFGRGAKDVYDIMRVTHAAQDQYTKDMREFGADAGPGAVRAALEFEEANARLEQQFLDVKIALGERLMPIITDFENELMDTGAIKMFEDALFGVLKASMEVSAGIALAYRTIEVASREMTDVAIGTGETMFRVSIGDYAGAAKAASDAWGHMRSDAVNAKAAISDVLASVDADIQHFELGVAGAAKEAAFPSGNKHFVAPPSDHAAEQARRTADEIAQIQTRAAEKHIETEARTNSFLLSMGLRTLEEFKAQAVELENERYQIELQGIQKREAIDAGNKNALTKDHAEEAGMLQDHNDKLLAIDQDYQQKKRAADDTALQDFIRQEQSRVAANDETLATLLRTGEITEQQRHDLEVALTEVVQREVLARFDAEHAGLQKGTDAYNKAMKERAAITDGFSMKIRHTDDALADEQAQKWKQLSSIIRSSFNSALNGLIFEGNTFKQFLGNVAKGIAQSFLEMGLKIAEDWIEQQIRMMVTTTASQAAQTAAVAAGAQARTAVEATAQAESAAVSAATGSAQIMNNAFKAAAGAYQAVVGIPVIGPILAPIAAGAAFAAVAAFDTLTSAEGGEYMVSGDGTRYSLHDREAVMPRNIADPMRDFFSDTRVRDVLANISAQDLMPMRPVSLRSPAASFNDVVSRGAAGADSQKFVADALGGAASGRRGGGDIHLHAAPLHVSTIDGRSMEQWARRPDVKRAQEKTMLEMLRRGVKGIR